MKGKQSVKPGRVHRALRLQHHRHTAKRLAHHHTSYRALFVVLAVAALSIGSIQRVVAADLTVNASVPSGALNQPADITAPHTGDTVTTSVITVSGTCQVVINGTIVVIERGGIVIGSTPCQSNGTFSLPVTLQAGANPLLPKVYDATNAPGPDGLLITVYYEPPSTGGGGDGGNTGGGGTVTPPVVTPPAEAAPIVVAPSAPFWSSTVGGAFELLASVNGGGGAPYTVDIDWGDGTPHERVVLQKPGNLLQHHTYEKPGMYVIVLTITDVLGANVVVHMVAVILKAPVVNVTGPIGSSGGWGGMLATPFAKAIWGAYLALMLATISLWLTNPYHIFGKRTWAPVKIKHTRTRKR